MIARHRLRRILAATGGLAVLVAALGLVSGRSPSFVAAATTCADPLPSLDTQTLFVGTHYDDHGYGFDVAPLAGHPSVWQFALSLPPAAGEHLGDTYYGYAHAATDPAGTHLCAATQATYVPADPYGKRHPHSVGLRLDGIVDTTRLTAHVTIVVAGRTIAVVEGDPGVPAAAAATAPRAMERLLAALNGHHWAGAYAMLDPQARRQVDEKTYARTFDRLFVGIAAEGRGTLRSVHVSDAIMAAMGAQAGYIQRVRVRLRRPAGQVYVHHGIVELILIRGTWYLGATDDWTR